MSNGEIYHWRWLRIFYRRELDDCIWIEAYDNEQNSIEDASYDKLKAYYKTWGLTVSIITVDIYVWSRILVLCKWLVDLRGRWDLQWDLLRGVDYHACSHIQRSLVLDFGGVIFKNYICIRCEYRCKHIILIRTKSALHLCTQSSNCWLTTLNSLFQRFAT